MNVQEDFWADYYGEVAKNGRTWLDYSNERVQAQTFALALESAGPVGGRRCLDIGCGWGGFSKSLSSLGASAVTGVDIVPEIIEQHQQERPDIRWLCGSLGNSALDAELGGCDIAFLLEVLQYVPVADALRRIWQLVSPGGRLVAVVPNGQCPIVARTRERFGGSYAPPTVAEIEHEARSWPELEEFFYRGLSFGAEQRVAPYDVSRWLTSGGWSEAPNRLQFVAIKRG